jgi:hypothetical protein
MPVSGVNVVKRPKPTDRKMDPTSVQISAWPRLEMSAPPPIRVMILVKSHRRMYTADTSGLAPLTP